MKHTYVDDDIFDSAVQSAETVLIMFSSADCSPCKMMKSHVLPPLSALQNVDIYIADIEDCGDTASRYNVRSFPTFLMFRNGQFVDAKAGSDTVAGLQRWLKVCA